MNLYDIAIAKKLSGGGGGGGGGSSYTLIASTEAEVSTSSTSPIDVTTISLDNSDFENKILYVKIRDKAGPKTSHFFGSDTFYTGCTGLTGNTEYLAHFTYRADTVSDKIYINSAQTQNVYGVYPSAYNVTNGLAIKAKYNASGSRTVDGTFSIEVYALDWPDKVSPFN